MRTLSTPDAGTRIESVEADVAGLPLRRPLERRLVDEATGEIVVSISHGAVPPYRGSVSLTQSEAIQAVEDSGLPASRGAVEASLVADPRPSGTIAVWLVDPPVDPRTLSNPVFAVDAETGDVRRLYDRASDVAVRAYYRNPALDPEPQVFAVNEFSEGAQRLRGPVFAAMNCVPGELEEDCVPKHIAAPSSPAGDFIHPEPDVDDPDAVRSTLDVFAEVSLYYHADKFMAWIAPLGVPSLDCANRGEAAVIVANYRYISSNGWVPYENARYTGDCSRYLVFGQGDDVDYAYDGDVVAHELGHAVVDTINGDLSLRQPRLRQDALVVDAAALNEAFADFFSAAHARDPLLGEYIGSYGSGHVAIRDNGNDLTCPASFGGESHQDSEAFAGVLWSAWTVYHEDMVRVAIETISLLPEDASMEQAAAALIKVTRWQLGPEAAELVEKLLDRRGLLSCRRVLPLAELKNDLEVQPPEYAVPFAPPPLQLSVSIPPGAATMTLEFEAENDDGPSSDPGLINPGVLIKFGEPFSYAYDTSNGWPPTLVHGADAVFTDIVDGEITVGLSAGGPVYVAFVNSGEAVMKVDDLEVEFDADPVDPPDPTETESGTDTDGESDGSVDTETDSITDTLGIEPPDEGKKGCSCRSSAPVPVPWILVVLFTAARRRGGRGRGRSRRLPPS